MKIHKKKTQQVFQETASPNKGSSPAHMAPVQKMDAKGEDELQMKSATVQLMESPELEEEEVQMKKGPVQMMESGEQEEEEVQMKKGPVQFMESPELEEEEVQMKKGPVQMMESAEQEEEVQMKRNPVQMMESPELEEEEVQMKKWPAQMMESAEQEEEEVQMKKGAGPSNIVAHSETAGNQMPDAVKGKMEAAFNADFSNVKIHEGDNAASMGALAYAQGEDIHFAPGMYNPNSTKGQELLGHELAHVIQQREGRVQGTRQAKGLSVNDDPALEAEADELAFLAAHSLEAEEEEEVEPSHPEYVVSTWGANILQEAAPHKPTGKQIPVGERLMLLSKDEKGFGKVKIQSTGEEVWTSVSKMTEVKLEIEDQLYRVSKEGIKIYPSPFSTKGVSVPLTQKQYLKIRESCGKYVRVEVTPTQWGWIKREDLLFKPKDTADNFASFTEITDWTGLDEVDEETYKKIEANRNAINDRTDENTYGKGPGNALTKHPKGGYSYNGKNLYDASMKGTSEKDSEVKASIFNEFKNEGGFSSMNTYDGEVFTYGRGFATGGPLVKLIKMIMDKDPKYKNIFLQVGIGIKGDNLVAIGSDRKVSANGAKKSEWLASQIIRSDTRLQSFFIELGEKKEYGQDVTNAQMDLLVAQGKFNYPSYVVDVAAGTFKDNWNLTTIRLMAHLKHWVSGANWDKTDYSDTKGDLIKVIYKYITETAKIGVFRKKTHSNNVIEWSEQYLILNKLKEFSEPKGLAYDTFVATYNDSFYKNLELKDGNVYLNEQNKMLKNAIILKDGGKYRIVVPMGDSLDAHLTDVL